MSFPPQYVVAGNGTLEVGKSYEVRHSRKGTFRMRVDNINDEWISGILIDGVAKAINAENVRYEGDEITIRDVHSYFIPLAALNAEDNKV